MERCRIGISGLLVGGLFLCIVSPGVAAQRIEVGFFEVDASPPVGSPLAYDPTREVTTPLSCRGIVLLGDDAPVVLCAVDWIGIGNDGQSEFRQALAEAAGTSPERVAVHTLHQHDAPRCDFTVDRMLTPFGINQEFFDSGWARTVIIQAAEAVRRAVSTARPVSHVGTGKARVEKVASNRRILGEAGRVAAMRWTACQDAELRALPEGTIDPELRMISLWNGEEGLVVLTYYATHPQSFYRTGGANPDFPGMARSARERETGIPHIHLTGASGNIGAGKWNDGSPENRPVLADRLRVAMAEAWRVTAKTAIRAKDLDWESIRVSLPPAPNLNREQLKSTLHDPGMTPQERLSAASGLAWLERAGQPGQSVVSCLRLGQVRVLHMPGELFVEYQLRAQELRPDLFIAMAAYGDYAPGYIGTAIAYEQGGYETSPGVSLVAPEVEDVLMNAMKRLLGPFE